MVLDDVMSEEKCLEVVVRIGDGGHGEEILLRIFENEWRDGAGGSELGKMFESESLDVNPPRVGEPIDVDAQFAKGLFENPGFAIGAFDQDRFVGDAAGEIVDLDLLGGGNAVGLF